MTKYLIIAIYDSACCLDVVSYDKVWAEAEKDDLVRCVYKGYDEYRIPNDLYERYDLIVVVEDSTITVMKQEAKRREGDEMKYIFVTDISGEVDVCQNTGEDINEEIKKICQTEYGIGSAANLLIRSFGEIADVIVCITEDETRVVKDDTKNELWKEKCRNWFENCIKAEDEAIRIYGQERTQLEEKIKLLNNEMSYSRAKMLALAELMWKGRI